MESPAIDLYAMERFDDGVRIYRSDDAVFEARPLQEAEARIYEEDGTWYTKIRFPEDELEEAYDRMITTAEGINDAYDTALDIAPKRFMDRVNHDGRISIRDADTDIHYVAETDLDTLVDDLVDDDASRASVVKGVLAAGMAEIGAGSTTGAALGGAIGLLGGPPGAAGGAMAGAMLGGGVTGVWTALEGSIAGGIGLRDPNAINLDAAAPMPRAIKYFEDRRKRTYGPDAIEAAEDHFEAVNRLNSMEQELDIIRELDIAKHEELESLRDSDVDAINDVLMQTHFDRFEDGEGVTVVQETETYVEAASFLATVAYGIPAPDERPSLYTAPDAFKQVFDHLTYRERGDQAYLDDAGVLVANVYDRETVSSKITDWLEDEHAELVQDVGRERSMT